MNRKKDTIYCWVTATVGLLLLLALDQYTKYLAVAHLVGNDGLILIPGVFELQYLENRGAAFGMLQNQRGLFIIMSLIILAGIAYCFRRFPVNRKFAPIRIVAVFLAAGAIGNTIDRVMNGYVVDFFYFSLIDFPVFNVADCYVTVSLAVLLILVFFYYKESDLDYLSWKYKKKADGESTNEDD